MVRIIALTDDEISRLLFTFLTDHELRSSIVQNIDDGSNVCIVKSYALGSASGLLECVDKVSKLDRLDYRTAHGQAEACELCRGFCKAPSLDDRIECLTFESSRGRCAKA